MIEHRNKNRILALVIAIMLIITIMPIYVANGEPEAETKEYKIIITVHDDSATPAPIEGADVTYKLTVENGEIIKEGSVITGEQGTAEIIITDNNNALSGISEDNKAYLSYYVEKTGDKNYASVYKLEEITAFNTSENPYHAEQTTLKEGTALGITSEHGSVKVNNVPVTLDSTTHIGTAYVVRGEDVEITIDTEKGYKLGTVKSVSGGNSTEIEASKDNVYALNVSEENMMVEVNYNTVKFKISVKQEEKYGEIKLYEYEEGVNFGVLDFTDEKFKDKLEVDNLDKVYISMRYADEYWPYKLIVKNEDSGQVVYTDNLSGSGTLTIPMRGNDIFEKINYNIQVSVIAYYHTVTIDSSITNGKIMFIDSKGQEQTQLDKIGDYTVMNLKITPDAGYVLSKLIVEGSKDPDIDTSDFEKNSDGSISGGIRIMNGISEDIIVSAEFVLNAQTDTAVPKITDTKAQIYTDRVTLSWDKVSTAEGYNVYVDGKKVNDKPITENTYVIKGLKKNTSYKVNVTSITDGSESEKSADISLATGNTVLGDLSGDGKVNIIDAMRIFHYVSGRNKNAEVIKGDINGDGKINIIDAMKIIHFISGRNKEY